MTSMTATTRRSSGRHARHVSATALCLALASLAGCSSSGGGSVTTSAPSQVFTLANQPTATDKSATLPEKSVTLHVGQDFAVDYETSALQMQWSQTSAGSSQLLSAKPSSVDATCSANTAGCGQTTRETYSALNAGTTTVVWAYASVVPCSTGSDCPHTTQEIKVTIVH
jgi:hypothetical protein